MTSPTTNPELHGASVYCQFAAGWYEGYSTFVVVETVIGSKGALRGASSADDLRRVLDDAGDNFDAAQGLRSIENPETKTGQITHRIVTDGGQHVEDISPPGRTAGKNVRAVDRLGAVDDRILSDLNPSQTQQLGRHLADSSDGSAATQLVNDLGPETTSSILRSDSDFAQVLRNHNQLPDHQRNRFANLLRDEDVGQSWLRVVSDENIATGEVRRAIERSNRVSNDGQIMNFRTGEEVNAPLRERYGDDFQPVHKPDSIVIDYQLTEDVTYYRVYQEAPEGSNLASEYTFRDVELVRQYDPEGISDRLALPNDPDRVATVEISAGESPIEMQVSTVADNKWGNGQGTQHIFHQGSDGYQDDWFTPSEELTQQLIS